MFKNEKMIAIIISIAVLFFIGLGYYNATKLQHIHIQKKIAIRANTLRVFENVQYLNNFPKWSPFYEADPDQKVYVTGNDGEEGARYHWEGNNGKDLGYQEIKQIRSLEYIKMECTIEKPFKANPTFEYSFRKQDQLIEVTQDFNLKSRKIDSFFMWLFGAKKEMEKMNSRGLELLKQVCEKE